MTRRMSFSQVKRSYLTSQFNENTLIGISPKKDESMQDQYEQHDAHDMDKKMITSD